MTITDLERGFLETVSPDQLRGLGKDFSPPAPQGARAKLLTSPEALRSHSRGVAALFGSITRGESVAEQGRLA